MISRVKGGHFDCRGCNGINNLVANSAIATIGKKSGVDGDVTSGPAFFSCHNCNFESFLLYGIRHYSDAASSITGYSTFAGDPSAFGSIMPLSYEVVPGNFPDFSPRRGFMASTVVFGQSYTDFANNSVVTANGIPPLVVDGMGPGVNPELVSQPLAFYWDTSTGNSEPLKRAAAMSPRVTVTGTTVFSRSTIRYIEANCGAACAITIPWAGWYKIGEEIIIKDISGLASTRNITVGALSGSTIDGVGSFTINKNYGSVRLTPSDAVGGGWRIVGISTNNFPVAASGSGGDFGVCWDSTGNTVRACSGFYDLGGGVTIHFGKILFQTDNASDIGDPAGNRPRDVNAGRNVNAAGAVLATGNVVSSQTVVGANITTTGTLTFAGLNSGALGSPSNGAVVFCTNCTVTSGADNTCAGGADGALAVRIAGAWRCFKAQN